MRFHVACYALSATLVATAVHAQSNPDFDQCRNITNNPDLAIKHCTRVIDAGKLSPGDRADAHHSRGAAWANKGDPDRALADFDVALKLEPKNAGALHSRAVELTVKGEFARALADYDAALKLDPKLNGIYFSRARTLFYSGDYARSADDFERAYKSDPNDYTALWLYVAARRGGKAGADDTLDANTRAGQRGGWPSAVITLYLGRTDVQSVMNAATDRDVTRQREQQCEANFYVAQWHLIQNAPERALPLLQEAQRSCPTHFLEYEGTVAELRRIKR